MTQAPYNGEIQIQNQALKPVRHSLNLGSVDKNKETYQFIGKIPVELVADVSKEELKENQNVFVQPITNSLGLNVKDINVTFHSEIDNPETLEATYVIHTNNPTLAEKVQKVVKTEDFAQNIHEDIVENSENFRERIREVLKLNNENVDTNKVTYQFMGKMPVELAEDVSEEELKEIQNIYKNTETHSENNMSHYLKLEKSIQNEEPSRHESFWHHL